MAEKRETLTTLLMELMGQKEERAKELQSRLQEMEGSRKEVRKHHVCYVSMS